MNARKSYFAKWKRESQLITLRTSAAELFYRSVEFREKVLQCIENSREQLELYFEIISFPSSSLNLELIGSVKKVSASGRKVISHPMSAGEVEFVNCYIEEFVSSDFSKAKNFSFQDDSSPESFDLSDFEHLETGTFYLRECINYHCLANLKSLEIFWCDSITDVSCFRKIPKLTLSHCPNITDVSSLSGVFELSLSYSRGFTDVSALGNVHSLRLYDCTNIYYPTRGLVTQKEIKK
jgi:hypothetical protein